MKTKAALLALCLFLHVSSIAFAQEARVARVTVLSPTNRMGPDLANAYKKHLEWHKQAADPWTWYAWQVISGEKSGSLVDITVVQWEALNKPVDPAADLADFNRNVAPEVREAEIELWSVPAERASVFKQPTRMMVLGRLQISDNQIDPPKSATSRQCTLLPRADRKAEREIVVLCSAKDWVEVSHGLQAVSSLARLFRAKTASSEVLRYRQDLLYTPAK
jgi:hypothetical protein